MKRLILATVLALPLAASGNEMTAGGTAGWQLVPWANTEVTMVPDGSGMGPKQLRVVVTDKFGRLFVQAPEGFAALGRSMGQKLRFSIRTDDEALADKLHVSLYRPDKTPYKNVPVAQYVAAGKLVPGVWHDVSVPVTDLDAVELPIGGVAIESEVAGTFTVDKLRLSIPTSSVRATGARSKRLTLVVDPTTGKVTFK